MRIDENIVAQARAADVLSFFEKHNGFTFTHRNGEYRCQQHQSLAVKNDRRAWYWHSKGLGGYGVLDYLVKCEGMSFRDAVEKATGSVQNIHPQPPTTPHFTENPPKKLILPEKTGMQIRLLDYLCVKRGIDAEIVNTLMQRKTLYEDKRGNVVFVGFDERGVARFASVRSTYANFRGDCTGSDKRYGFNIAAGALSKRLYIFESPIDLLSHATLAILEYGDRTAWNYDKRLSLAGTTDTAMPFFLNQHKAVKEIVFCLDSDPTGRNASIDLMKKYSDKGYTARIEPPQRKDYSEDLQAFKEWQAERRDRTPRRDVII